MSRGRRLARAALVIASLVAATGCTDLGGVDGIVGGPLPADPPAPGVTTDTTTTTPASSVPAPAPTAAPGPTPAPGPAPPPPAAGPTIPGPAPGGLRLGGADLGVTRVGAPFREAVAAVAAALGPPTADPAPDTACIGAEDETTWGPFRLARSGGAVSGWLSTSRTLATPAGVTVGTPVAALRQAYGPQLQVRPPIDPDSAPVFVVAGAGLGGTLSGQAPTDTVASLYNGTCESA